MKDSARTLFSKPQQERIRQAVSTAEKLTSGEIVCLVVSSSYHYPVADILAAATFALPAALVLTPWLGGLFWIGMQNMWLFIGLFAALFAAALLIVKRVPALKRRFISPREIEEEVREAAITNFFKHGLYRTREGTGVLLFISVFEHKVWVLADHGISAKVEQGQWDAVVAGLTDGIRKGRAADAVCEAVAAVGEILHRHFPAGPDDSDELSNLIITRQ